LGNLYRPMTDEDARDTLSAALDAGITYVDTAPRYGHGLSERRVGEVLRDRTGVTLSSKVGRIFRASSALTGYGERNGFYSPLPFESAYDYSYGGILRSYEDSLQRLGLARIDILYIHDIGRLTHGEGHARAFAQLCDGGFRALEELRQAGAIGGFGLGVNEWEVCVEAMAHAEFDVILLAGRYTLLEQEAAAQFLDICTQRNTSVVIGGAYNSGILATGTRRGQTPLYDYKPAPESVLERVRRLETVCDEFGLPLAAAALQFPLAHPAVVSVIPGLGSVDEVTRTIELYRTEIPAGFWIKIRESGLLDARAPLPGEG
jgi:D-threo-aldose 1-dehydrogenase